MSKDERMAPAKDLFMLGYDQGAIARIVKVSQNTMSRWVNTEGWREERAKKNSITESISDQLLDLIDYQLIALKRKVEEYKASGELKLLDKGEIDALSKLFAGVKGKELTWTMYVSVVRELNDYVASKSPDLARALVDLTDSFLMTKREHI